MTFLENSLVIRAILKDGEDNRKKKLMSLKRNKLASACWEENL